MRECANAFLQKIQSQVIDVGHSLSFLVQRITGLEKAQSTLSLHSSIPNSLLHLLRLATSLLQRGVLGLVCDQCGSLDLVCYRCHPMNSSPVHCHSLRLDPAHCHPLPFDTDVILSALTVAESTGVRENPDHFTALLDFLSALLSRPIDSTCTKRILQLLVHASTVSVLLS